MALSKANKEPKPVMEIVYQEFVAELKRSQIQIKGLNSENSSLRDDVSQEFLDCLPIAYTCPKCFALTSLMFKNENQIWKLKKFAETIIYHEMFLQYELKTNNIKWYIKWVYVIGIGISLVLSAITVDFYAKKQIKI